MVRFHPLPLFRDGAGARVLRRGPRLAAADARRLCNRLSDAAARRRVLQPHRDRSGRRRMMLMSVALMTAAMLATGLLPTRAMIGPAAGWLLLLLRCVMGFSVGGEYTGVVAYLLEGARPARRGLITSCASAASEVGALLAVGVSAAVVSSSSEAELSSWA